MTTPSDSSGPTWASPSAAPAPAPDAATTPGTPAGTPGHVAAPGGPVRPGEPAGPAEPGGPVPPSGWGPGYTSPTAGPPGYGTGPAPEHLAGHMPGAAPGHPGGPVGRYGPPPAGFAPVAPRPGIIPLRPLALGEILDGAFRAIRANPRVMFGLSAIVVAVTVAIQSVLQWYVGGLLAGELSSVATTIDPTGTSGLTETLAPTLAAAATSPLISIAVTVLTGLLIVSVSRSVIGQRIGVAEVWSRSWRRVLVLLALSFVATLVVLAVWGGLVTALVALASADRWGAFAALGAVGGLVLLVATVWFGTRVLLVPATLVLEGTGVRTAIARGWRLTRGSFWRLLGIYVLTSVMAGVVASLVATPATVVSAFVLQDPLMTSFGSVVLIGLANVVAYTLTTSFMAAVVALLYVDVRMRREGLDVELARAAAGGTA